MNRVLGEEALVDASGDVEEGVPHPQEDPLVAAVGHFLLSSSSRARRRRTEREIVWRLASSVIGKARTDGRGHGAAPAGELAEKIVTAGKEERTRVAYAAGPTRCATHTRATDRAEFFIFSPFFF